jgi:hypothetical protein
MSYEFKYPLGAEIGNGYLVRGHCYFLRKNGGEEPMYWLGPLADSLDRGAYFYATASCVDNLPPGEDPATCSGCPPPMIPPC